MTATQTISMSRTVSVTPTPTESPSLTPSPSLSSAPHTPPMLIAAPWGTCSAVCGNGTRYRDVRCVTAFGVWVDMRFCTGSLPTSEPCFAAASCSRQVPVWSYPAAFLGCSSPCFNGSASSLGFAAQAPPSCVLNGSVVSNSTCNSTSQSIGQLAPLSCNRFACPAMLVAWTVSAWGSCTPNTSGSLIGTQARTVACTNSSGHTVADAECADSAAKPAQQQPCSITPPPLGACAFASNCSSISGSHYDCVNSACVCSFGWAGPACTVRNPVPTFGAVCWNGAIGSYGTVDVRGSCCVGATDTRTGSCCGAGVPLDRFGSCCGTPAQPGRVDSCGVCGGTAVAVDIYGACCPHPLPASGICCMDSNGVDSCGVCGGRSECSAAVNAGLRTVAGRLLLTWNASLNTTITDATTQLARVFTTPSSNINVSVLMVSDVLL